MPKKRGAVRTRIALTAALVGIVALPTLIVANVTNSPTPSVTMMRHRSMDVRRGRPVHAVRIKDKVMSYSQANRASRLIEYANAVHAKEVATFYQELTYFQSLAAAQAAAAQTQAAAQAAAQTQAAAQAAAQTQAAAQAAAQAQQAAATVDATSTNTPDWACIRLHESSGNYVEAGGGAYQFNDQTWTSVTGLPGPAQSYPAATQDAAALRLYSQRGWEPWTTRYVCGL